MLFRSSDDMRKLVISQLKDGRAVWFGSDVGQFELKNEGILSTDGYEVGDLFNTEFTMDKAERLDYGESCMTHAMVITGVNFDKNGDPERWKVENSWGKEACHDGYFIMSDEWFGEYVYQILLDRKYFSKEQSEAFDTDPVVLKPWDPLGTLAND